MSHSKKRYVIFTLRQLYDYNCNGHGAVAISYNAITKTKYGWTPSYFSDRKSLIGRLAVNKIYSGKDSIIDNLSDSLEPMIPELRAEICDDFFGRRTLHRVENKYFICSLTGSGLDGLKALTLGDLGSDLEEAIANKRNKRERKRSEIEYRRKAEVYRFRSGNVPGIGGNSRHRGTYYRIPRLKNVVTANCSCEEETKSFVKSKYKAKNVPVWDDRLRHNDKSWKTSCKVRKQWMKHLDNHTDTIKSEVVNTLVDETLD